MNKTRILFQGDSITDGNRYKTAEQAWDKNHQIGHSYAYMISGTLGSLYPEKHLEFINRSISGNRAIDVYARINEEIIDLKPDILSILLGVNDMPGSRNGVEGTKPDKFDRIYRMMLEEIKNALPQVKFVLCEPFLLPVNTETRNYEACVKAVYAFQEIVAKIAEDYHGIFIPLQKDFDNLCKVREPEYWCWDGVHPTESGHGIIARKWLQSTKEYMMI